MIAVAARGSKYLDVTRFVRDYFGNAPVTVYLDGGSIGAAFRVVSHPDYRFVSARGHLRARAPAGFPFS